MSKFAERVRAPGQGADALPPWFDELYEQLPEIASVLAGTPKGENGEPAVPPMSITLKSYQGRLQFTLSRKGSPDMWCGVIERPSTLLVSLEGALGSGAYEPVTRDSNGAGHKGKF